MSTFDVIIDNILTKYINEADRKELELTKLLFLRTIVMSKKQLQNLTLGEPITQYKRLATLLKDGYISKVADDIYSLTTKGRRDSVNTLLTLLKAHPEWYAISEEELNSLISDYLHKRLKEPGNLSHRVASNDIYLHLLPHFSLTYLHEPTYSQGEILTQNNAADFINDIHGQNVYSDTGIIIATHSQPIYFAIEQDTGKQRSAIICNKIKNYTEVMHSWTKDTPFTLCFSINYDTVTDSSIPSESDRKAISLPQNDSIYLPQLSLQQRYVLEGILFFVGKLNADDMNSFTLAKAQTLTEGKDIISMKYHSVIEKLLSAYPSTTQIIDLINSKKEVKESNTTTYTPSTSFKHRKSLIFNCFAKETELHNLAMSGFSFYVVDNNHPIICQYIYADNSQHKESFRKFGNLWFKNNLAYSYRPVRTFTINNLPVTFRNCYTANDNTCYCIEDYTNDYGAQLRIQAYLQDNNPPFVMLVVVESSDYKEIHKIITEKAIEYGYTSQHSFLFFVWHTDGRVELKELYM